MRTTTSPIDARASAASRSPGSIWTARPSGPTGTLRWSEARWYSRRTWRGWDHSRTDEAPAVRPAATDARSSRISHPRNSLTCPFAPHGPSRSFWRCDRLAPSSRFLRQSRLGSAEPSPEAPDDGPGSTRRRGRFRIASLGLVTPLGGERQARCRGMWVRSPPVAARASSSSVVRCAG